MNYEECDFSQEFINRLIWIDDPPAHLWRQGKIPRLTKKQKVVSIVGARRCTPYGENIAYDLAFKLAKLGVIIVSGLAYGIDSCAHRGCL